MKKIWLSILVLAAPAFAGEPLAPISFAGGVDYGRLCSQILDERACDSSNMYGDRVGSAQSRNGSHPLIATAVSSQPFSSLFWTTISTSNLQINVVLGVSGDTIYYSTQDTVTSWLVLYRGLLTPNQKFTFQVAQNAIYMTGNALTDPIFKWDVTGSSFTPAIINVSTSSAIIFAKYLLWEGNYMFAANVRDVRNGLGGNTTYYDDRVYYSYILDPSSFTVGRFEHISPGDGEYITGVTSKRSGVAGTRLVELYKPSSVYALTFKILNPAGEGGDQNITKVAEGFGHIADSPPENIGAWDIMFSRDGILQWNGGLLTRANLEAEKVVISGAIRPLIAKLILRNTYRNSILKYYPKGNYLVFAYEDPDLFPQGRANSATFYDLLTGEWWPMRFPFSIGSVETDKGPTATGKLHIGDGMDGYVHVVDDPVDADDSRHEISLDPMEQTNNWANAGISTNVVAVGTASLRLQLTPSVKTSSITRVFVMPMGEWYDKSQSSATDRISFKVWPSSVGFLSALRVDLQVQDAQGAFNTNFSSVTISSAALTGGSSNWTTIEIAFSSFPIAQSWVDFQTESVPFARNLTRFGIRFVATTTVEENLFFDDLRFVASGKTPLNPFRLTKNFNLGSLANKDFQQVLVSRERYRDSSFNVDVLTGQGFLTNTIRIAKEIPKEIFVCEFSSIPGITKLSSVDFSVLASTITKSIDAFKFENGAADKDFIYGYNVSKDQLVKISRSSMSVFVSTYGALGSGTSNFNYVQEIAVETKSDGNILVVDHMNHRLKEHKKKDFTFVRKYGQLGTGSTSFYNPTGVDWDSKAIYVGDDSNQKIVKYTRDYQYETEAKLDINTIGNISIKVGPQFLFDAYNRGSDAGIYYIEVVLEKRNKSDLSLVNRATVRPLGVVANSTYSLTGSIALHSRYVDIAFNDASLNAGNFYLQKRLQSDFSIVKELVSTAAGFGLIGDNLSREPSQSTEKIDLKILPDPYVQLKFYIKDELESSLKLSEMTFAAEKLPYTP